MVSLTTVTTVLNLNQEMTDFNYKKYSLENLENWMHDAISSAEATPQEIYDTIKNVVQEQHDYHKDQASRANQLLDLLNGVKKLDIDLSDAGLYMTQSPLFCNSNDSSPECQGAWNDFWGNDTLKVDDYSVDDASHSKYWYDYDRNDPNHENPFVDKVVKWQLPVQVDGLTGDCYIELPDDLLEVAGLKEGDIVEWVSNGDGSYLLKKIINKDT